MSAYEDMSAADLRDVREEWHGKVVNLARELLDARESNSIAWEAGIAIALRQALAQVRRIERLLELGVVA